MHVTCMCQGRFVQFAVVVIHYGRLFYHGVLHMSNCVSIVAYCKPKQ